MNPRSLLILATLNEPEHHYNVCNSNRGHSGIGILQYIVELVVVRKRNYEKYFFGALLSADFWQKF